MVNIDKEIFTRAEMQEALRLGLMDEIELFRKQKKIFLFTKFLDWLEE